MSSGVFTKKESIAVFRTVFPLGSETFIREQVASMSRFTPRIIARDIVGAYPHAPLFGINANWRKKLWTLSRWPWLFSKEAADGVRLIHAHFGPDAVMVLPLARKLRIPLVTTFHGADITTDPAQFANSVRYTERVFAKNLPELIEEGAAYIAVSKFVEQKLLARGFAREKVHQIYIGVDTERFVPAPKQDGPRYLLCVARHTYKKGLDTLIQAWAKVADKHPDVELWQVGEGGITANFTRLADELGVSGRMRFLGAKDHATVLSLMQQAEAFVLPSQTAEDGDSEALGIVFNEAAACAIPVLSTFHGGIPEAVMHGETGLLCPERDADALAANMDLLLSDQDLQKRLGQKAREFVCEQFDIRKQTPKLEALYAQLIHD